MRFEKQTSKHFYQHTETGEILVVEKRWDNVILGSCPAAEPLRDLSSYVCKPDNNLWIQEQSDKLILYSEQEQEAESNKG